MIFVTGKAQKISAAFQLPVQQKRKYLYSSTPWKKTSSKFYQKNILDTLKELF